MKSILRPERIAHTEAALAVHAPHLVGGFLAALPAAADTVGRRLRAALVREGLRDTGPGRRHGFGRVEYAVSGVADPVELLGDLDAPGFAAELRNAVLNLAIALARPPSAAADDPDGAVIGLERLAVAGHNLHPCGRTRLGWDTGDVLAHDLETPSTRIGFVAVREDAHLGDEVWPEADAPPGYRVQPVHAWQRDNVLPDRYGDLLRDGTLRILDDERDAVPTAALRTLLLPGTGQYLKVSLDIQVTSTRRSISVASARNGPAVSALLHRLVAADPDGHRIMLMAETAGAAVPAAGRDLAAIRRTGLAGRLQPGERAIPGGALPLLLGELVTGDPATWLREYTELVVPPLLRLTAQGVALEAHLQNCLPTFVGGRPHRLALRDFAGLRLHLPRLAAAGHDITLWPGSVVGTDDLDVLRAKIGYTLFQAHLGEVVMHLDLDEDHAWRIVRAVVDEHSSGADHAAFTAPLVPHKALVRMRLAGAGDIYVPVPNPLHASA